MAPDVKRGRFLMTLLRGLDQPHLNLIILGFFFLFLNAIQ